MSRKHRLRITHYPPIHKYFEKCARKLFLIEKRKTGEGVLAENAPSLSFRAAERHARLPAAADVGSFELNADSEDALGTGLDLESLRIDGIRDFFAMNVNNGVVATLGEYVDEHGKSIRILKHAVFCVDHGTTGNRMALDDGQKIALDQRDDFFKELALALDVGIEAVDEFLTGVLRDREGDGDTGDAIVGRLIELQRALVAEFFVDPLPDDFDGAVCINEVIEENLPQVFEGTVGFFLKGTIAIKRGLWV